MYRTIPALVVSLVILLLATTVAHAAPDCSTMHCISIPLARSFGPGAVTLVGQPFTYTDSIDYLHIIGQVSNTRNTPVDFVKIAVTIFDSQNKLVATDFTYARFSPLPPNTTTCFEELVKAPADIGSIQFEKPTYSTTDDSLPNLTVLNDNGTYDPNSKFYRILGQIRNDDTIKIEFVSVTATLFNNAGQAIGCDFTYINSTDLEVGQASAFDLLSTGRDYSDVTSYSLQAKGSRETQ